MYIVLVLVVLGQQLSVVLGGHFAVTVSRAKHARTIQVLASKAHVLDGAGPDTVVWVDGQDRAESVVIVRVTVVA